MTDRLTLLALAPFALASVAPAPVGAADSPSVDEIVERHLEARGGVNALRAIRTLVYSGGLYAEGDYTGSGDAMMAFARPYFRVVGNPASPGGYMEGYDGAAWEWFAEPGIVIRTVGAAAGATRRGADFEGPFVDHRRKGTTIDLGEPAEIGGRPAHRLIVTLRDGFVREYFIDRETYLVTAERRAAPIHAFGEPVASETRIGDYRPALGSTVLFAHSFVETEIAGGRELSRMQWGRIEANRELPAAWFSPPVFERGELQRFLENLYGERTDREAVLWSYHQFRRAHPEIETRAGVELIGYQMLKMGELEEAIALLEANAGDHPESSSAAFSLGRARETAGDREGARREYERALRLDAEDRRAAAALAKLGAPPAPATAPETEPLAFLERFVGDWAVDPASDFARQNPESVDDVAFRFEWADPGKKILRFYEGIPDGDLDRRVLENLVTFDPRSGTVHALGYQLRDGYLYESTFRPLGEDGYEREYKVTYPQAQPFRRDEDRERGWILYRDRCRLAASERLHCVIEQQRGGQWEAWGSPEGFTVVRLARGDR